MNRNPKPVVSPPKLTELEHPYAELIARGNHAYVSTPEETERFCRTRGAELPKMRPRAPLFVPIALAAAALLALGVGLSFREQAGANEGVDVSAETIASPERAVSDKPVSEPPAAKRTIAAPIETNERALEAERGHEPVAPPDARDDESAFPTPPASTQVDASPAPEAADRDCRELARSGKPKDAEACYLSRATGSGLDAETALLEVARLRRDVLDDPAGALGTLEHYRTRFPNGALRREADFSHVALLTRLGRAEEALIETQKLLDAPNGRERAFELHLLRGNVYRKNLKKPALAAREYEAAERLDATSSEASYLLGVTLEELGDTTGAVAAYRRHLDRSPHGKRSADVRRRLGKFSP